MSRPARPISPDQVHWIPESILSPVHPSTLFPSDGPVSVDFGCGEGAFVLRMAERHPERNFLATERLVGRVEKVCKTAARLGLTNLRVLRLENLYTAKYLLPPDSLAVAYVSFPDPWPKRAHHPRRLIQPEFLDAVRTALVPGGELRIKTDDLPYFQWIEKVIQGSTGWLPLDWPDSADEPLTNFEARFIAQGLPIHKVALQKAPL